MHINTNFLIFIALLLIIVISVSHFYLNKMIRSGFSPNKQVSKGDINKLNEKIDNLTSRIEALEKKN